MPFLKLICAAYCQSGISSAGIVWTVETVMIFCRQNSMPVSCERGLSHISLETCGFVESFVEWSKFQSLFYMRAFIHLQVEISSDFLQFKIIKFVQPTTLSR